LTPSERKQREALFGSLSEGLRPSGAYVWRLPNGARLLEIPTTTVPLAKLPFHMSYLLYLRRFSKRLMVGYLRGALAACRLAGISPSFLLHPLDLLSADEVPALSFFPGMSLPLAVKQEAFMDVLRLLSGEFEIVTMGALAERLLLDPLPEYRVGPLGRRAVSSGSELAPGAPYSSRIDHAQSS
jgi:peptidoglycan-N-acetylglucosamine deacetylase